PTRAPFFSIMHPTPPISTLLPYTTLFRSNRHARKKRDDDDDDDKDDDDDDVEKRSSGSDVATAAGAAAGAAGLGLGMILLIVGGDRKSTRLNSSHQIISYAVFCLKKKENT